VRFYLDEDIAPRAALALRARGRDTVSAHECGMLRVVDAEQLAFAAREGRCLVTRNAQDFIALSRAAIRDQVPHAGIVCCPPGKGADVGAIVRGLLEVARRYPRGLGEYDLIYLP
jgi:predicted nuclease of predicted toxin-antitoxin system